MMLGAVIIIQEVQIIAWAVLIKKLLINYVSNIPDHMWILVMLFYSM